MVYGIGLLVESRTVLKRFWVSQAVRMDNIGGTGGGMNKLR